MRPVQTTTALVWSRMRFDWKRHVVAGAAVAILMASFLVFNAVSAGLDAGLQDVILEEGHDRIQVLFTGFGNPTGIPVEELDAVAAWPGVVAASARSAKPSGLEVETSASGGQGGQAFRGSFNVSRQVVLVGIDPAAEADLVTAAPQAQQWQGPGGGPGGQQWNALRGSPATAYHLMEGRWLEGPAEAVATQTAAQLGLAPGAAVTLEGHTYTVVGVVSDRHPAALNPPGVVAAGHLLVDRATQEWESVAGAYLRLEPSFGAVHGVTTRLAEEYPQASASLQGRLAELEKQHYDAARTQQVLAAAARLVGLAGAATVFAMALFLLIGERRPIGTMSSVGFSRRRLASYMNQKMLLLTLMGVGVGAAAGWLVVAVLPSPEVSFEFRPLVDGAVYALAAVQTLASALLGALIALLLTIRQDPIRSVQATE